MPSTVLNQDLLHPLSPEDRVLFSRYGVGERLQPPFPCIHHAFEFQVRHHPDSIAVEDFQQKITYAKLDRQANCLATRLRMEGRVFPSARVCLLAERSIPMVVGILAILKAGAAYIPLDGNIVTDNTLRHALNDSAPLLVLAQRKFVNRVNEIPTMCLEDSICRGPTETHCVKPVDLSGTNDSAYIIYTSGKPDKFRHVAITC